MIPENAKTVLKSALKKGGEVLLEYHGTSFNTARKESISSVVTEADLEAEKAIFRVLETTLWKANIISEEAGYMDRSSKYTWVVDPLDGTSNFAAGLPWFGVIITLCEGSEPVLAGMHLPVEGKYYMAEEGKGCYMDDIRIELKQDVSLEDSLIAYSFDFSEEEGKTRREMELVERLSGKVRNMRSTNSLMDFCLTLEGKLGAAINQTTRIWDIAAPWLMFREAGGKARDLEGKHILFDLSPEAIQRNYTIVAAGESIHKTLIDVIQTPTST